MKSPIHAFTSVLAVSVLAMAASVLPPFSGWIHLAANNMWPYPGPDIHFDYFIGGLCGLGCGVLLLLLPLGNTIRPIVIYCWSIKIAAALILTPFYEFFYGMDSDGYFFFAEMPERPNLPLLSSGTWNIRFLAWLLFKVIGPSYHGGKVFFSFIGFMGVFLAYRGATAFTRKENSRLFILMALVPTSLFWATTLGKDPINLFGVGLYCFGGFRWLNSPSLQNLIPILIGVLIAANIRSYFLPIMVIPIAIAFLIQSRAPLIRAIILPVVIFGVFFSVNAFKESMRVDSFEAFVRYQSAVASGWQGGSSFSLPAIDSPAKLALVAPLAIFTALFRPTLFEAHNMFSLAAALDNAILLLIFCYAAARSRTRELLQPQVIWMITFVVIWAIMYGFGAGNLGAISRFKIQALPLFTILLVYMARKRTINAEL